VSLGCAAQWLKRPRAPRPLSALAVMACGRELSAVACGRRVWYETVACGRRVWPVADGCTLLYQDIAVRLTDDDTRSNVNIGLWPDDVGRDKTCRQCIPCSDHTCMFFIFAGLKFRPCISLSCELQKSSDARTMLGTYGPDCGSPLEGSLMPVATC
jgi:hypothetical protein